MVGPPNWADDSLSGYEAERKTRAYRPHDPLTAAPFLWPVYGFVEENRFGRPETLAVFFDRSAAEDFAMHPEVHGFERRNVYVAAPRYDRRG